MKFETEHRNFDILIVPRLGNNDNVILTIIWKYMLRCCF